MMTELTQEYVRSLFDYRNGELYWAVMRGNNKVKIGDRAGHVMKRRYRRVMIDGKLYLTHRLIFLWHHGYLPEFLDHIDNNPSNNKIDNLREATRRENNRNVKKRKSINGKPTTSKFKGVTWHKASGKWAAQIGIGRKTKYLGLFTSEIDAATISDKALIERDGKFAVTNKSLGLLI